LDPKTLAQNFETPNEHPAIELKLGWSDIQTLKDIHLEVSKGEPNSEVLTDGALTAE